MRRNCLRINHEGDAIQLSWQRGQSNPRPAPSVTFTHLFDEQALTDLRWYLEEYLRFPYGLAPDNADRAKLSSEYLELLKLLGGHPFSLRVVLPHLKTQQPKQLIEALRQGLDTLDGTPDKVREKSLAVSLDYSFAKLPERARRHWPFLALFSERVDADWLHAFSSDPDDEDGQAYQTFFGENLQKADWLGLLNEAAEAGILEHLSSTVSELNKMLQD